MNDTFEHVFKRVKQHMQYHYTEWYIVDIVNSPVGIKYPCVNGLFEHEYIDSNFAPDDEHTGFVYLPYLYQYIKVVYYT